MISQHGLAPFYCEPADLMLSEINIVRGHNITKQHQIGKDCHVSSGPLLPRCSAAFIGSKFIQWHVELGD